MLGAIDVGDGARIGSGSVVIRDVPAGATVVGVPGQIVLRHGQAIDAVHANLPDPVAEALRGLSDRMARIEQRVGGAEPAPGTQDDPRKDRFAGMVEGRSDWPGGEPPKSGSSGA